MESEDSSKVTVVRSAWLTLVILSGTFLVVFFSQTLFLPAIPEIMRDFCIPYGAATWIFSAYLIVAAVMTPIAGKLLDLYEKKKVLLVLLALSATVIAFFMALTLVEAGIPENLSQIAAAFAVSLISLAAFVAMERKSESALLNLRLLKDRVLMPSQVILMASGITMYLAYPSIAQLVRSPSPLGFGGSAADAESIQVSFMIMFLVLASVMPFIINRVGRLRPNIIGAMICVAGSFTLLLFHATTPQVSANLSVIASGLSMTLTARMNLFVSSSPKEFLGISMGVGAPFTFIGMLICPALAGVYMEDRKTIEGADGSYPSPASYDWVFLMSGLLSVASLAFALVLGQRAACKEIEVQALAQTAGNWSKAAG